MRQIIARRQLRLFAKHYQYDTRYLEAMLRIAPSAFFKFARLFAAASHREAAPPEAAFAAKLYGALHEDCGPCVQLVADMALEAGIETAQIEAVLRGDRSRMSETTDLGYRFAESVAGGMSDAETLREAIVQRWGEKALVDLSLALAVGRVFPMTKRAMGYARTCQKVRLHGREVHVPNAA